MKEKLLFDYKFMKEQKFVCDSSFVCLKYISYEHRAIVEFFVKKNILCCEFQHKIFLQDENNREQCKHTSKIL